MNYLARLICWFRGHEMREISPKQSICTRCDCIEFRRIEYGQLFSVKHRTDITAKDQ
jgi:hypothetical protein